MSGIERVKYIESNNLDRKKLSGIRNREDPVLRVFYHIKYRREKFGTDEIVRFHGDSGIERIRFRGVLLYQHRHLLNLSIRFISAIQHECDFLNPDCLLSITLCFVGNDNKCVEKCLSNIFDYVSRIEIGL